MTYLSGQGDADWTRSSAGGGKTIREAYAEACTWLAGRGVAEAAANAELLLQELLGWSRTKMLLNWSEPFPEDEKGLQWQQWLGRKAMGEPVQYIIGEQTFYGLDFRVGPAVLIPRPETELLVERVLKLGAQLWPDAPRDDGAGGAAGSSRGAAVAMSDAGDGEQSNAAATSGGAAGGATAPTVGGAAGAVAEESPAARRPVLGDVGTGSGAIPVTIAVKRPDWRVYGSDISAAALEMARGNAARHGARVEWLEGDLLEPYISGGVDLDILVSNPPYIPAGDMAGLQPEVRLYEPQLALVGGEDGLVFYRRLADELRRLPRLPQLVAFEVGQGQADGVLALLQSVHAWQESEIVLDLAGISRHVIVYDRVRA
ncbi:N5-glutamine methyltransferase family protein [Paenibacillus chartarius]|uniref:Release factor glutamine methyltransferase n=1 Tax=Paenibacillus chartarius TaxID=747481 RepID=A0ABV6DUT6_9BACL